MAAISKFYFRFWPFTVIGMCFCTLLPTFMQIGWLPTELWRHIDFTRWLPWRRQSTSGFWFGHIWHLKRSKLSAYQISTSHLNLRRRYCYFRFVKTNGRHIEILLPVSILTFSLDHRRMFFHRHIKFHQESDQPRQSYDVIAIFKMAVVSHVVFGLG